MTRVNTVEKNGLRYTVSYPVKPRTVGRVVGFGDHCVVVQVPPNGGGLRLELARWPGFSEAADTLMLVELEALPCEPAESER